MLGILLIYFIGKSFYKLAQTYEKHRWLYAIMSVIIFFGIQFFIGFVIGFTFPNLINDSNEFVYSIGITIVAGFGIYGVYQLLEKNWKKNVHNPLDEIDKLGKE